MVSQRAKVWHVVSPGTPEHRNTTEHGTSRNTWNSARKSGTPRNTFQKTRNIPEQLPENPEHPGTPFGKPGTPYR